mmetsp:Transcript_24746/g.50264  ORF Transcript_24746/g.50264 Transcript_24746/m.50264 type:complete len:83 (+) Transcript_24746:531-779(+)
MSPRGKISGVLNLRASNCAGPFAKQRRCENAGWASDCAPGEGRVKQSAFANLVSLFNTFLSIHSLSPLLFNLALSETGVGGG